MTTSILATKLLIPQVRPTLVARPPLMARLDEGLQQGRQLTLVSASAGYGKTTLVAAWCRGLAGTGPGEPGQAGWQAAWLSLDAGDNDPGRFLAHVVAALQRIEPTLGESTLHLLAAPAAQVTALAGANDLGSLGPAVAALINDLAMLQGPTVLVLDDYHAITTPAVNAVVRFLLDHQPPALHLLVASRSDPPLPLARLRSRDQLTEVRIDDLRFTDEEAAVFLEQVAGLTLSPEQVAALEARSEGWIAGLQLAALSLRGRRDVDEFIQAFTGSHAYILDYLVEEVLQQQPAELQQFLLRTSILEQLCGPLCDAVLISQSTNLPSHQSTNSQSILEQLDKANLFVVPLDDQRHWYRYHRLFRDLLRHRLQQQEGDLVPVLHSRAAAWYQEAGQVADALEHWLQAGDAGSAAGLVEQVGMALLEQGQLVPLLGWIQRLPAEEVDARPWLATYQAWALLLTGQLAALEQRLEQLGTAQAEDLPELPGHLEAIRAYQAALTGETDQARQLARSALSLLPKTALSVRSIVAFTLGGVEYLAGKPQAALQAFVEAARMGRQCGNIHLAVPALSAQANLLQARGHPDQALATYREGVQLATGRQGDLLPVAASALSGLGEIAYERNDLEAADAYLTQSKELADRWGNPDAKAGTTAALARLRLAQGRLDEAQQLLGKAAPDLQVRALTATMEPLLVAEGIRLALRRGDLGWAGAQVAARGLSPDTPVSHLRWPEHVAQARVLLAQDKRAEALSLLERLVDFAVPQGWFGYALEPLLLRAVTLHHNGNGEGGISALMPALALAEPWGYVRPFVDEGKPMVELLQQATSHGIYPGYVDKLLAVLATQPDVEEIARQAQPAGGPSQPSLVEPLSDRELEVLGLVAAGLTNRQIGERLVITVGTVKAHTSNIYGKLGVRNRTQAVARARELGLL